MYIMQGLRLWQRRRFLWDMVPVHWVTGSRRFQTALWGHLQGYKTLHYYYCHEVRTGVRFYDHLYLQPTQLKAQENIQN